MYNLIYNENTVDIIKDIEEYLGRTKESLTRIDTLDLCHLIGYIRYLEKKLDNIKYNTSLLEDYEDLLKLKIFDIRKELER